MSQDTQTAHMATRNMKNPTKETFRNLNSIIATSNFLFVNIQDMIHNTGREWENILEKSFHLTLEKQGLQRHT